MAMHCACVTDGAGKVISVCGAHTELWRNEREKFREEIAADMRKPVSMLIVCPCCGERHIDEGEFATRPHHTHACQHCGHVWRPAIVDTVGVRFLPGYKNEG